MAPRLAAGRGGRDGNITTHLSKVPTASPCTGLLLTPSTCQQRGICRVGKVVSTNCWFFTLCSPSKMWLPGREHLPCKLPPDHKATLTLANRHMKRCCKWILTRWQVVPHLVVRLKLSHSSSQFQDGRQSSRTLQRRGLHWR